MTFDYYTVFFAVMGVVILVAAFFAGRGIVRWFNEHSTPLGAVVFVLGESFVFYCGYLGITAAFTKKVAFGGQPPFLLVPLAFALAAAMHLMRKRPAA